MDTALVVFCGVAAGVIKLIGLIPYVRDIFRKKTKPERATWWIWTLLNFVALAALIDAGARWQLGMNIAQGFITAMIAILSLTYGFGKFHRKDFISIVIAVIGVLLWQLTDQPLIALLIVVTIDAVAVWLTAVKTWKEPATETLITWILSTVADVFGVIAIGAFSYTKIIYPFYLLLADGAVMAVIIYRRAVLNKRAASK